MRQSHAMDYLGLLSGQVFSSAISSCSAVNVPEARARWGAEEIDVRVKCPRQSRHYKLQPTSWLPLRIE
ncbi:hypothetical protein OBBRIDRAFT_796304 [Obba rivulosa]|uniref:Uncharacterized protein n=1 Tax=Obba rivulosa TaxID=1052685 RepID=A0A8E2DHQ0_9APHY|nr:hypothetical protein OBBRIDRAFT_796304 [Obba rivulosa]